MALRISPGITVQEIDQTTTVPAVVTSAGAFAGVFSWGPSGKISLVVSENDLVAKFGKPSSFNAETWFSAASFLAYSNQLQIARAVDANTISAIANTATANAAAHTIYNEDQYDDVAAGFSANVQYIAKYAGERGNSLRVSVCDTASQYSSTVDLAAFAGNTLFASSNTRINIPAGSRTAFVVLANTADLDGDTPLDYAEDVRDNFSVGDILTVDTSTGSQDLKIKTIGSVTVQNVAGDNTGIAFFQMEFEQNYRLAEDYSSNTISRNWEFYGLVSGAPGTSGFVSNAGGSGDELHVVIVDAGGQFSTGSGTVLEVYDSVSRATDARDYDGAANYYKTVINQTSPYVWVASDRQTAPSAPAATVTPATGSIPLNLDFNSGSNGGDEGTIGIGALAQAFDLFKDSETTDVSLLFTGKARGGEAGEQLTNYLIDNIAEVRRDLVVFGSPTKEAVVNAADATSAVLNWAAGIRSSSYAVLDSGYKYQYDKYNDLYRWVPLNADTAGLCAFTDAVRDPWWSPAGFNRGFVKNVVKLAYSPVEAQRDMLYKNRVNPVVSFRGQGTVLYGDKTALGVPSAFDRINVRRLFITLEKAIAEAAKAYLFEFNDSTTRTLFKNMVEPYLRDIQGRRGIHAFRVVCDESNNTAEVIDSNRFVGDIYIQPARSINHVQLNFTAVRTNVSFTEIVGNGNF